MSEFNFKKYVENNPLLKEEIKSGDEMKVGSHKIVITDPDLYSEKVKSLRLDLEDVGIDSSAKGSRYSKFIGDTFNKFDGDVYLNGKKINYDGNSQIEYIESHGFAIIPNDPSKDREVKEEKKEVKEVQDRTDALDKLRDILEDLKFMSREANELLSSYFPSAHTRAEAYGALDFGTSSNRYDTTLESIIDGLERGIDVD
jgi:hypothetical protein